MDSAVILIQLPNERPVSKNAFYVGMHWSERRDVVAQAKAALYIAFDNVERPCFDEQIDIEFIVYFDHHPQDASNLLPKPYEDGLIDLGVIVDDSPEYVRGVWSEPRIDRDDPRVELWLIPSWASRVYPAPVLPVRTYRGT